MPDLDGFSHSHGAPHIANIVFDIGNVLYGYDPSKLIRILIGETPYHEDFLVHLFHAPLWQALDRGDVSEAEALASLSQLIPDEAFVEGCRHLLTHFSCHLDPISETHGALRALSEHYPVYLLTNFQSEPYKRLFAASSVLPLSRGAVVSADENCMKPESKIYDILLSRFKLVPEQTLFIDDMMDNVVAARAKGMQALHFESPTHFLDTIAPYHLKGL